MGRLFWKFFFFIWLAQLTAIIGVSSLWWVKLRAEQEQRPVEISQSPPATFMVNAAASTLQFGGPQALKGLLESREPRRSYSVLAVDESGREALGREVAPALLEQARALAAKRDSDAGRGVREVKAADGHTYVLFLPAPVRGERGEGRPEGRGEGKDGRPDAGPGPRDGRPPEPGEPPRPGQGFGADGPPPGGPGAAPGPGPRAGGGGPPRRSALREWRLFPIEPVIGGVIASFVFAALLALYIARPIRSLRNAFDAAASGNLQARVGPDIGGRRDELADLGRDFDHMASRLQAVIEGQRRLLHDVSHEMRSPLARMQAAIGLARQGGADAPLDANKLAAAIERVERETVRIDALVGELLTLSRLDSGVAAGRSEAVNVAELVADIVEDARFEAEAGGRNVAFDSEGADGAVVQGSVELLHRAFENVIRNAVKHTATGTQVEVAMRIVRDGAGSALHVTVEDSGPGVREDELQTIFEPFFRAGNSAGLEGHGLGLAIARRVVQTHGGTIKASNRAGGGLRMEIALPLPRGA